MNAVPHHVFASWRLARRRQFSAALHPARPRCPIMRPGLQQGAPCVAWLLGRWTLKHQRTTRSQRGCHPSQHQHQQAPQQVRGGQGQGLGYRANDSELGCAGPERGVATN